MYGMTGRTAEQRECLEKLVEIDPGFPNARFNLGLVLMSSGDLPTAVSIFAAIRKAQPDNRRSKINEALCLREMGNYRDAIRLSETIEPADNAEKLTLTSHLALCYYAVGEKESAGNRLSQWADMDPLAMEPLVYLSKVCAEKEDIDMCVEHCDRLLTLLGFSEDRTLNRPEELGELFFKIAGHFRSTGSHDILCRTCCEVAAMLGYKTTAAGAKVKVNPD
jgi:tetratricopeptide (TPR) repeat protein